MLSLLHRYLQYACSAVLPCVGGACDDYEEYTCKNTRCIRMSNRCDGHCDCGTDCDDELDCGGYYLTTTFFIHNSKTVNYYRLIFRVLTFMLIDWILQYLIFLHAQSFPRAQTRAGLCVVMSSSRL